jgi:hypothetical protein
MLPGHREVTGTVELGPWDPARHGSLPLHAAPWSSHSYTAPGLRKASNVPDLVDALPIR